MLRLHTTPLRLEAAALVLAAAAAADAAPPRVWCWTPPEGAAAGHPSLQPLVRVWMPPGGADPTVTADQVCDAIVARNLGEGNVAITILNWGRGTLIGNPLDGMTGTGLPDHLARGTPWSANGIAAMGAWTDAFIARYQQRQATQGFPSPSRFHMDSELRLPALCYLPDVDDCWGTAPLQVFDAMQDDPRWAVERLPMNPAGIPALLTMAELHAAGGSPGHDASLPRDHPVNRAWSAWWDGVMREAVEGAFDAALFSRVHQAWPEASCSEFAQSMRLDGGSEPGGGRREYIDFEWWNEGWMRSAWCGRGDLQAPAIYVFGETFVDPARPFMDEQMRLHRANLDACLHSFGGAAPETITPWVTLPGIALPFGEQPPTNRAYADPEMLRIYALFRSRGIKEFMVWPSADATTWSSVAAAIDADLGLAMPDFRAEERSFSLLCQLAGRAGREGSGGRVILQTWDPSQRVVRLAARHAVGEFLDGELARREALRYPPTSRLVRVVVDAPRADAPLALLDGIADALGRMLPDDDILG
ncbi:MAG: hypothetical protein ACO3DS_10760, partial [Phycisphaerales bacterium]